MTSDEIKLCDLQGMLFEQSLSLKCSSSIFIRRFMNSNLAKRFDNAGILNENKDYQDMLEDLNSEYSSELSGSKQFGLNELFWIGYIYRYWQILYKSTSKSIYKVCNSEEMRKLFFMYHTLDPEKAVKMILEAKNIDTASDFTGKGVTILRKIRAKRSC